MKKSKLQTNIIYVYLCLPVCLLFGQPNGLIAQTSTEVEGQIFSKRSTLGYNLLMTNTDNTKQSDLTMYSGGSSFSLYHYGSQHATEPSNTGLFFSKDIFFKGFSGPDRFRIQSDGNLVIGAKTPSIGRAILNPFKTYHKEYSSNVVEISFDDNPTPISGRFTLATSDSLPEGSGMHANGDAITFWSPGDIIPQLGVSAFLVVLDEDDIAINDGNPYNDGATKAYLNTSGMWTVSDRNKKESIQKLSRGSLEKIKSLNAYSYQYKRNARELEKSQIPERAMGLMAQELEQVIPEAVNKTKDGEYFVNYNMVTPVLIEAIKEQQKIIDQLKEEKNIQSAENQQLKSRIEKLENVFEKILQKK
ncbi:MAG: tail fiber domain-containing protein [Saprospiraceae bacterium]|nr:tail fiber domain-containing protein [Saprospiraceae bacterium]